VVALIVLKSFKQRKYSQVVGQFNVNRAIYDFVRQEPSFP
jgi:hypothetical protein